MIVMFNLTANIPSSSCAGDTVLIHYTSFPMVSGHHTSPGFPLASLATVFHSFYLIIPFLFDLQIL